jgi:hypothetical protein
VWPVLGSDCRGRREGDGKLEKSLGVGGEGGAGKFLEEFEGGGVDGMSGVAQYVPYVVVYTVRRTGTVQYSTNYSTVQYSTEYVHGMQVLHVTCYLSVSVEPSTKFTCHMTINFPSQLYRRHTTKRVVVVCK